MPSNRSSSSLGGLGLVEEPLKVFTHASIDIKNIPDSVTSPIERIVSMAERIEIAATTMITKVEQISISFEKPLSIFIYSLSISMIVFSSGFLIITIYRINDKKK